MYFLHYSLPQITVINFCYTTHYSVSEQLWFVLSVSMDYGKKTITKMRQSTNKQQGIDSDICSIVLGQIIWLIQNKDQQYKTLVTIVFDIFDIYNLTWMVRRTVCPLRSVKSWNWSRVWTWNTIVKYNKLLRAHMNVLGPYWKGRVFLLPQGKMAGHSRTIHSSAARENRRPNGCLEDCEA